MSRMREGSTTDDYRAALGSLPDEANKFGTLSYEWADKPHRLIYDLCGEIDALRHPFRNADDMDWDWLMARLGDSGHGRFWRAVMTECRVALMKQST